MSDPTPETPLLERITPKSPVGPDGQPRSEIYSEKKLANDYDLMMKGEEGYDPNKSLEQKQRELFGLYKSGRDPQLGPIQAWEWVLARKWNEWDEGDKKEVWDNLSPEEKANLGPIRRIFG